jgi:serine protease Do
MILRHTILGATLLLAAPALITAPPQAQAALFGKKSGDDASREAIERAVDAVYPALVRIHVVYEEGDSGKMQKRRSSGSGAIISEDGYIITNHHVAGRATRLVCRLSNREEVDAVLVGTDALSDLAILKLDLSSSRNPKQKLSVAKFGDSDKLAVGDVVLAMGSPAGVSQSVTKGIVANTAMISPSGRMVLDGESVGELVRWIGHDAVIFGGNSGGPLVNLRGEIIGVNEVGLGSLGGAIPSNLAQAVAKELIAKGRVSRSWIGLEPQPLLKKMTEATGVLVASVLPGSPALKAGIQAGDFIHEYNGDSVIESRAPEDLPVFNRMVLNTPVGASVTLKGTRAGQPMTWKLTTIEREASEALEFELVNWGLTVRDFTSLSAMELERPNRHGVLVHSLRSGGPGSEAKPPLRGDDVITKFAGKTVTNSAALIALTKEFIKELNEPKPVVVTFERDSQEFVSVVRIGPEVDEEKPARPAKAWLGAQTQVLTRELAEALDLEGRKGVRITQVVPGSPAEKGGIKTGDIFLKLDGQVIAASTPSDQELFENLIRQYKVTGTAELEGVRDGKPLKLAVPLGRQPKPNSELEEYKDEQFEFSARELSLTDRIDAKLADTEKGVRIGSAQNAGWAALAGLSSGDILLSIDGQPVEGIAELKATMKKLSESKPRRVAFFIKRGIRTQFIELEPKW